MDSQSKKQQFTLLSSISNYHYIDYPSFGMNPKYRPTKQHVRFLDHILYDPTQRTTKEGLPIRKYIPASPRNKLSYFTMSEECEYQLSKVIAHLLKLETLSEVTHTLGATFETEPQELETEEPPSKKRKHTAKLVSVNPRLLCDSIGVDLNKILNSANQNRNLYTKFQENLISDGLINWRLHDNQQDICVMSDINTTTGLLVPNSYVHVTCTRTYTGEQVVKCTCDIYNIIKRAATNNVELLPGQEFDLDNKLTCMHCRFYFENLTNVHEDINYNNQSKMIQIVKSSFQYMNDPVQLLGNPVPKGTTKFSVKGHNNYSVVNISFPNGKCYAKCQNGMCKARMQNKKKVPKQFKLSATTHLCSHLNTLYTHLYVLKQNFPDYFTGNCNVETEPNFVEQNSDNIEDSNLTQKLPGSFNASTGLWEYKSLSNHKPHEMFDPSLIKHTQYRNSLITDQKLNSSNGLYSSLHLTPNHSDESGQPIPCDCGAGYGDSSSYVNNGSATLYTRMGPVDCKFADLKCSGGNCMQYYQKEAQERGIFFYSSQTCAGDEVGWDFISLVMKTKISFTGYCNEMTRRYSTNNVLSGHFMSPNTFISWFFGWLAAFKTDFRKEIDPWCSHNPEILACDGTHIGVSLRNMKLDNPVTSPDNAIVLKSLHKRGNRVIITDVEARRHLKYMSNKYLGKISQGKELNEQEEGARSVNLLQVVNNMGQPDLYNILETFLQQRQDTEFLHCLARVFHLLSGDAAMSSVAPFPSHPIILLACQNINNIPVLNKYLEELKAFSVDLADLIHLSVKHDCSEITKKFLQFLITSIEEVHCNNRDPPVANEQQQTYYPPGGTAYYFTENGNKLRDMPTYDVCKTSNKKNYDDNPSVEDHCNKYYPDVSFGGYGYMFLWFCPIHGHSYGFHLINSAEGRKDPFSSIYKYMEKPPKHIFMTLHASFQSTV